MAVLIGLVAALADSAYELIFSQLNTLDDEGSVTVTLRSFAEGEALYDDVYTQYGPGFFTIVGGAMELLGVAFTNDGARLVNLFFWLASTLLAGLVLLKLTRNLVIASVGLVISYLFLTADAFEPLHPGAAIGFVLLCMIAALAYLFPSRIPAAMAALGALVAVLLSVKVNVGAFAAISIALTVAVTSSAVRPIRLLAIPVCLVFVLAPFALMYSKLGDPDTARYAAIVAVSALGLLLVAARFAPGPRPDRRDLGWLASGALAVVAVVAIVPIALGTSPGGLVDSWLIEPLRHADVIFASLPVDGLGPVWAAFGLASATAVALVHVDLTLGKRTALAIGRIAIGLLMWLAMASPVFGITPALTQAIVLATPFAWVAAIAPRPAPQLLFVRVLIPALAILQTLHAFPVPGTQLAWSQILFVIVGGICLGDGIAELSATRQPARPSSRVVRALATAAVLVFGTWFAVNRLKPSTDAADTRYALNVPLDLPGAERIRTDLPRAEQLRDLTAGIRANCQTFVTLPGLNSLYFYTGLPVPEELSSTWMMFFTDEQQQAVVDRVRDTPGLCAIRKPDVLAFWAHSLTDGQGIDDGPLTEFIRDDFRTLHNYQGYYLEVRRQPG